MTDAVKYNDYSLEKCAEGAREVTTRGGVVFQKWTCDGCGDRVTASTPNKFTTLGRHDEPTCGCVTDLRLRGCNYMAVWSSDVPHLPDLLAELITEKEKLQ